MSRPSPARPGSAVAVPPKPRWRGRLHQAAFFAAVPAGVALVAIAPTWPARLAAAVYAASLAGLYGTSAAFHLGSWGPVAYRRMDQADQAMIYLLIAGTYTPVCVLVLTRAWATGILAVVWLGALAGVATVIWFHRTRGLGTPVYLLLGWISIVALPELVHRLGAGQVTLLVAGGLLYTAGAVVLSCRRPNPSPRVFGYHEVWHACTIAAGACHFALIWLVVASAGG